MDDDLRRLESRGVRLVIGLLLGLGVAIGSIPLLYFPLELVVWIPAVGLGIAIGLAIFPWRPLGYVATVWSAVLVAACVVGIAEFARADAPIGVLLTLFIAGFCFVSGGLLEIGVLRRRPRVTFDNAD